MIVEPCEWCEGQGRRHTDKAPMSVVCSLCNGEGKIRRELTYAEVKTLITNAVLDAHRIISK